MDGDAAGVGESVSVVLLEGRLKEAMTLEASVLEFPLDCRIIFEKTPAKS